MIKTELIALGNPLSGPAGAASSRPAPPHKCVHWSDLEADEAAVRVPDHESGNPRGAGEDVGEGN